MARESNEERARRAAAELKETEDLLAGFDRPGRTPRVPPVKRDFVDYHLEKRRSNPEVRSAPAAERSGRDMPTAIIPGHKRALPAWLPWGGLLVVMSILGVLVAAAVSGPPLSGHGSPASSALTSAATTLASGTPAFEPTSGPARDIPPPPPSTSEATPATESSGSNGSPVMTATGTTISGTPATDSTTTAPPASTVRRSTSVSSASPAAATAPSAAPSASAAPTPSVAPSATVDLIRNL